MRILNNITEKLITEGAKQLVASIFYTEDYSQFQKINTYLRTLQKAKYDRHRAPGTGSSYYGLTAGTKYVIKIDRLNLIFVSAGRFVHGDTDLGYIRLDFFGPDRYYMRSKFIKKAFRKTGRIDASFFNNHTDIYLDVSSRDIDSVVMSPKLKKKLTDGVKKWANDKDWYLEHGLPYKLGIMLRGKPGTGKSTIVRAISHMLGDCPISIVSTDDIFGTLASVNDVMKSNLDQYHILLIEDIDMLFPDAKRGEEDPRKDTYGFKKMQADALKKQRLLFQVLDGLVSLDNLVIVATTNYYEDLDDALVRPGRFSIDIELEYFDRNMALELVKNFGLSETFLDSLNLTYPVQPSYLQDLIIEERGKVEDN